MWKYAVCFAVFCIWSKTIHGSEKRGKKKRKKIENEENEENAWREEREI